ncbi:hypothetical protein [Legionella hackeliae]|uniref:Uncharacterized protein n=1 Tax=Legionella hackeliae TaxID=449 RepID=A0A0A8ULZ4_LEGHA|nr:hypothetical protein [Legionella hackeliae]KTD10396.1 hypothetical protein Lhac_2764 [Legionella hackeliae]CEK09895.1 protein of unknown function [Legionella hackeliae]STX49807.1 Uncharacterised protein [Legionella hackeliae]
MIGLYSIVVVLTVLIVALIQHYRGIKFKKSWILLVIILIPVLIYTKLYIAPFYHAKTFEADLKKESPLFALLAEKSPLAFQNYIDKAKHDIVYNHAKNILPYTVDFISAELTKYTPHATNESLYNEVKITAEYYDKILKINPLLILFSEFPDKFADQVSIDEVEKIPGDFSKKLMDAKLDIIQSALNTPQLALSPEEINQGQTLLNEIFEALINKYGNDTVEGTFHNPDNPNLDRAVEAKIILEFYQRILDKGEKNAGLILKYIETASASTT